MYSFIYLFFFTNSVGRKKKDPLPFLRWKRNGGRIWHENGRAHWWVAGVILCLCMHLYLNITGWLFSFLEKYIFSVRRWRNKNSFGAQGQWELEVGDPMTGPGAPPEPEMIRENFSNVSFLRPPGVLVLMIDHWTNPTGCFCRFASEFHTCRNLLILCLHSLCLHVKIQRPASSGESATSRIPEMYSAYL